MDKDNSGYISLDEFSEACELMRQHFPHETHEQLMEICRMMDINKDGLVDLNEFLEAFRLCESTKESLSCSALAKEPPKVDPGPGGATRPYENGNAANIKSDKQQVAENGSILHDKSSVVAVTLEFSSQQVVSNVTLTSTASTNNKSTTSNYSSKVNNKNDVDGFDEYDDYGADADVIETDVDVRTNTVTSSVTSIASNKVPAANKKMVHLSLAVDSDGHLVDNSIEDSRPQAKKDTYI